MIDYSLWEVIKNGNKVLTKIVGTVEQTYEPTSVEETMDMKNKIKARGTLLMALPNKDQLKFHSYQDAKLLMKAIEKRLQKLISQLEIQGEVIEQEDINLKLLRSLPSKWKSHALISRNKAEIETIIQKWSVSIVIKIDTLQENVELQRLKKTEEESVSYQVEEEHPTNYALMALTSSRSSSSLDFERIIRMLSLDQIRDIMQFKNQKNVKSKSDKRYHAVPPPYTGNYLPPKLDLMFIDEQVESEYVDVVSNLSSSAVKTIESKVKSVDVKNKGVYNTIETKHVKKNNFSPPIIEDWNSDDESDWEDILKLKELMELSTKLSDRVLDLNKIKTAQAKEIADFKKRVKKLERKRRSRTPGMNLFRIGSSRRRSLGEEDAPKQGRNLKQRSIFEESDFDVQAMMDADYELAARLRAEE
nr:hypothetical protein [Tanacetum cinerariifolium]